MKIAHRIVAVFTGIAMLVALVVAASFWAFGQIEKSAAARQHVQTVIDRADDLLSALIDAETGSRGYALTGDEAFLEPYLVVREKVNGKLEILRELASLNAAARHLDALAPLIAERMAELARFIALRRSDDAAGALAVVKSGQGKRLMDSIRVEMRGFIQI